MRDPTNFHRIGTGKLIDQTFDIILDYKLSNVETASYIERRKREGDLEQTSPFYSFVEREISQFTAIPLDEARDVLKISEDRRQHTIRNTTTLFAGLIGGIIGAALTFLLTHFATAGH